MALKTAPEAREKIIYELLQGRKIAAIKLYRENTGLGLKESKEQIENLIAELKRESPGLLPEKGSGCGLFLFIWTTVVTAAMI